MKTWIRPLDGVVAGRTDVVVLYGLQFPTQLEHYVRSRLHGKLHGPYEKEVLFIGMSRCHRDGMWVAAHTLCWLSNRKSANWQNVFCLFFFFSCICFLASKWGLDWWFIDCELNMRRQCREMGDTARGYLTCELGKDALLQLGFQSVALHCRDSLSWFCSNRFILHPQCELANFEPVISAKLYVLYTSAQDFIHRLRT